MVLGGREGQLCRDVRRRAEAGAGKMGKAGAGMQASGSMPLL